MESEKGFSKKKEEKTNTEFYIQIGLIVILALVIAFNIGKIYGNSGTVPTGGATGIGTVSASEIIPKGVPAIYGKDMVVSYDDISASNSQSTESTIGKLSQYEDIKLDNATLARYIRIGSSISCEYCCGAQALIFKNGDRACGCAHSYAMRGLAKYLLTKHPEMTDVEILNELGKWKVLFFPGVHEKKAAALKASGIDYTNQSVEYIYLASNLYRGIENQTPSGSSSNGGSQQVGNC